MEYIKKIKIWQQVLIIAIGFLIPIVITLYTVVKEQGDSISYSYDELKATAYFFPVFELLRAMQYHRSLTILYHAEANDSNLTKLNASEKDINNIFNKLSGLDSAYGEELKTTKSLAEMQQQWLKLRENNTTLNPIESAHAYSQFIEDSIVPFIHTISNNSNISLDPLTDGYSLFDTITRIAINLSSALDRMRAYGIFMIAKGKDEKKEQLLLEFLLLEGETILKYLKTNFEWTSVEAPNEEPNIRASFYYSVEQVKRFLNFFDKNIVNGEVTDLSISDYMFESTKAINSIFDFVNREIEALEFIFNQRITDTRHQRFVTLIESGLMISIAILFCFFVIREIKNVMGAIRDSSIHLVSTINEITGATRNMASDVIETSNSITQVSGSVEKVFEIAHQSTEKAHSVLKNAERIENISQTGMKSSTDALNGINHIQVHVNSIADNMVRLNKQSQAIGSIIASVEELSKQSNILALNASLLAFKAGEQGKGFEIIVQEINRLAKQSKQDIDRIRPILDDVTSGIRDAYTATDLGKATVIEGVKQSLVAGQSFSELYKSLKDSTQIASEIVDSSQVQFSQINELKEAVTHIKLASEHNAEEVKGLEKVIQTLNNVSLVLKKLMDLYRA